MSGWTKAFALPALAVLIFAILLGLGACSAETAEDDVVEEPTFGPPATTEEMLDAGIPVDLVPIDTAGRGLVSVYTDPADLDGVDTATEAVFVRAEFEGGLLLQASSDSATRLDQSELSDKLSLMTSEKIYSSVSAEKVGDSIAIVSKGDLPLDLVAPEEWSDYGKGTAVQWADSSWYYTVWIEDSDDAEIVLDVARSVGR